MNKPHRDQLLSPAESHFSVHPPFQEYHRHQPPQYEVQKTMCTMKTLGIRLRPPGICCTQDAAPATTVSTIPYYLPWRPDSAPIPTSTAASSVSLTPPTTHAHSYGLPPNSSHASYTQSMTTYKTMDDNRPLYAPFFMNCRYQIPPHPLPSQDSRQIKPVQMTLNHSRG